MTLNVYSLKKFCTNVILIWCNNCACGVFCVSHSVNDADDVYRHQKNHTRHNTGVTVNRTGQHRTRTGPGMTDYFVSTTN